MILQKRLTNHIISVVFFSLLVLPMDFTILHAQEKRGAPKDIVVLLHGLGRGKSIMVPLQTRLEDVGFSTVLIDYHSINRSPDQILTEVTKQIDTIQIDSNQTIHFVGHSLGGLIIRAYLDSNTVKNLGKVILIGSPNNGTPFVDHFRDTWWLKLVGSAAASLGTDNKSFPRTLRPPYYPVGIIAGISKTISNDDFIPGEDDGIVPVESTKVEGMKDFILLEVSHSALPRNELVAQQVIEFLKHGKFFKENQKQK
ncbi:MAG: alpha/beta hydrolase [Bacteroidota bacterium]|nr:alpha/beta hydrolase [Bacteroidota bacterium]